MRNAVSFILMAGTLQAACAQAPIRPHPSAVTYQSAGAAALAAGDLDRAAGLFSLALEYEPRMREAHNGLGVVALRRGEPATAESYFRSALALDDDFAEAHVNLGWLCLARDEVDAALARFTQAVAIDPGYGLARLGKAEALVRMNRMEDARWELAKLCEIEPDSAGAHGRHALVLARLGHAALATEAARCALALDPVALDARRARAWLASRAGDPGFAIAELRLVLSHAPSSIEDRVALVTALVLDRQWREAERELAALEAAAPSRVEPVFVRAYLALEQQSLDVAIAAAQRALALRPRYPEARMVLAEALYRAGRPDEGRRELNLFLQEAPPHLARERALAQDWMRHRR